MVAVVGPVGSGKTTLAYLLLRLYDPTLGSIAIDGIDIKRFSLASLRNLIGYLPQEPFLFSTTVLDNIRYGKPEATMDEVFKATCAANAYSFICELPNKFDTKVDERGGNFSGGQRQMLALARLILRDPPILILDEPTAAIDSTSERLIQDALRYLASNRTTIVISHRLSTIYDADWIYVLHEGQVVGQGRHTELIAANAIYNEIYNQQVERVLREQQTPTRTIAAHA
jgi:ATP-binding cassette subfamily B protein